MSNRVILYLTALVLIGMVILFSLNLVNIFSGQPNSQAYIKHNQVRGIAVKHNQLLYTLNFRQQNDLIDLINRSLPTREMPNDTREDTPIAQIVVYLFGADDLVLSPVAYINDNLVYSTPQWNPNGYFMDLSNGTLKNLLSQTYDP